MLTIEMFHGGKIEHSLEHQELDLLASYALMPLFS